MRIIGSIFKTIFDIILNMKAELTTKPIGGYNNTVTFSRANSNGVIPFEFISHSNRKSSALAATNLEEKNLFTQEEKFSQFVVVLKNGDFVTRFDCKSEVEELALLSRAKMMVELEYQKRVHQLKGE